MSQSATCDGNFYQIPVEDSSTDPSPGYCLYQPCKLPVLASTSKLNPQIPDLNPADFQSVRPHQNQRVSTSKTTSYCYNIQFCARYNNGLQLNIKVLNTNKSEMYYKIE